MILFLAILQSTGVRCNLAIRSQFYVFLARAALCRRKVPFRMNPQDGGISGGFYICHSQRNFRERRRWKGRKKKKGKKEKLRESVSTRESSLPSASTRKDSRPARTRFSTPKLGPSFRFTPDRQPPAPNLVYIMRRGALNRSI